VKQGEKDDMTTYDDLPKIPRRRRGRPVREDTNATRQSVDFGDDMPELRRLAEIEGTSVSRLVAGMISAWLKPYAPGELAAAERAEQRISKGEEP
jgi:hypothetical protein